MPSETKKLFWSSDMVDPKIRDENYRAVSSFVYEIAPWDINGEQGFRGSVSSCPFGSMTEGATTYNSQKFWRSRRRVVSSAMELYLVSLFIAGSEEADFNGRDVRVKAGDILIVDMTQTLSGQETEGARMIVVVARSDLQRLLPGRNLHGVVLDAAAPATRLLAEYFIGLNKVLADLSEDEIPAAQEAFLLLLASAINGGSDNYNVVPVNMPMRQRIIDYIHRNLENPRLGPQDIVAHFRVSRSHLYRAFEADGGIATLIREKRLDLAYRLLSNQKVNRLSNKEIIYRCGLPQSVNFSKIFKERFGVRPAEAREQRIILPDPKRGPPEFHTYLQGYVEQFEEQQNKK